MPSEPEIPFGYKLVEGQAQKGDGIWDGDRFRKVRKEYPSATASRPVIRRCVVSQEPLSFVDASSEMEVG